MLPSTVKLIASARTRLARGLRAHRTAAGLTQADVASRAGLTERTYQRLEAGELSTSLGSMAKLGSALGVDPADLFVRGR